MPRAPHREQTRFNPHFSSSATFSAVRYIPILHTHSAPQK